MFQVLGSSWALLLGMLLLMMGNGLQGTLLGVRGGAEGFSTFEMSIVMSAYFVGFLGGSRITPELIRRVGHVRVFAALASFVSAILILYPLLVHPLAWILGRIVNHGAHLKRPKPRPVRRPGSSETCPLRGPRSKVFCESFWYAHPCQWPSLVRSAGTPPAGVFGPQRS